MSERAQELPGWSYARVVERHEWAPGLITLRVDAKICPFEPGQFFNLGLQLEGGLVRRAYSAASAPGEPLEFFLAKVDEGQFSPTLFGLREGGTLWVEKKPQGFFSMRYLPQAANLWLIASGTGLGPFISMLRSGEPFRRFERVVLVHGVRGACQQAYREELVRLSENRPFQLLTCFSRDDPEPGVLKGRVTQTLQSGALEAASGVTIAPEHSHVMLCGNPDMIAEMTQLLKARGLARHRLRKPGHITTEKYW